MTGQILRYTRKVSYSIAVADGFPNFHHGTVGVDGVHVGLERGINLTRRLLGVDGTRLPAVLLRSSPWKVGRISSPWHDIIDSTTDTPAITATTSPGRPPQRATMLDDLLDRHEAPHRRGTHPRRADPAVRKRHDQRQGKGHVRLCGLAVVERLELLVQRHAPTGESFTNIAVDLALLDLSFERHAIDWRWIDDRCDATLSHEQTLRHAPKSWRRWIDAGASELSRLRRRVQSSLIRPVGAHTPPSGSPDHQILLKQYHHVDGRKHAFELLASRIAGHVRSSRGGTYDQGWVTRGSGDGSADFVARLDVGDGRCVVPVVVLGQAKCVAPDTSINAERLARVVARLRRGSIGVHVTTGAISHTARPR